MKNTDDINGEINGEMVSLEQKKTTYLGGIDGAGGKGVKRGHVGVFALHCLLRSRAVVDAAHHFGSYQRT